MNNFYQILGVSRTATKAEIKSAFRKLARKYHPDVNKELDASQKFRDINKAYKTLSDDGARALYNKELVDDVDIIKEFFKDQPTSKIKKKEKQDVSSQSFYKGMQSEKNSWNFRMKIDSEDDKLSRFFLISFFIVSFVFFLLVFFLAFKINADDMSEYSEANLDKGEEWELFNSSVDELSSKSREDSVTLHNSMLRKNHKEVKFILENGLYSSSDLNNKTFILQAIYNNWIDIVELLIENGFPFRPSGFDDVIITSGMVIKDEANYSKKVRIISSQLYNPADLAKELGYEDILNILQKNGINSSESLGIKIDYKKTLDLYQWQKGAATYEELLIDEYIDKLLNKANLENYKAKHSYVWEYVDNMIGDK